MQPAANKYRTALHTGTLPDGKLTPRQRIDAIFSRVYVDLRARGLDGGTCEAAAIWARAMEFTRLHCRTMETRAYFQEQAADCRFIIARARQFGPFIPPYMRQRPDGTWFNANWEC